MRTINQQLFFCYAQEDIADVRRMIANLSYELDADIVTTLETGNGDEVDEKIFDRLSNADVIILFVSEASKNNDFVRSCVTRASHLNKNIIPIKIGLSSRFSKMPEEFKFRGEIFSGDNDESKAKFFAQLKAILGISVCAGDSYGRLFHVVTDVDVIVLRYGKELGKASNNSDFQIRLAKGMQMVVFRSVDDIEVSCSQSIEVPSNDGEDYVEVKLKDVLDKKKAVIGQKRDLKECIGNVRKESSTQQQSLTSYNILSRLQIEDFGKWSDVVKNYPIPTNRSDFLRFVKFLKGNSNNGNEFGRTCNIKLDECKQRAMVVYPKDLQLSIILSYGWMVNAKVIWKLLLSLLVIAVFVCSIVLLMNKCNRNRAEETAAFRKEAFLQIDAENDRIDSIVVNLPVPKKSNYVECAHRVKAIRWYAIDCDGDEELIDYQNEKRNKMRSRVNDYIYKLQKIEPDQWHHYEENPKFVKIVEDWGMLRW